MTDAPDYDAGLLNDWGGGNVEWWQDYIRAYIGRANEHWRDIHAAALDRETALREALEEIRAKAKRDMNAEYFIVADAALIAQAPTLATDLADALDREAAALAREAALREALERSKRLRDQYRAALDAERAHSNPARAALGDQA